MSTFKNKSKKAYLEQQYPKISYGRQKGRKQWESKRENASEKKQGNIVALLSVMQ